MMFKTTLILSHLAAAMAFQPAIFRPATTTSTRIGATQSSSTSSGPSDPTRIKKAGCGVPTIPTGNCLLFDPEEQGKLQGSGQLSSRIHDSTGFILPQDDTIVYSSIVESPPDDAIVLDAQEWLEHQFIMMETTQTTPNSVDGEVSSPYRSHLQRQINQSSTRKHHHHFRSYYDSRPLKEMEQEVAIDVS